MRSLSSFFVFSICLFQCARATPVAHAELEPVSDHDWPGMETRHTLMRRAPHHAVALQKREHFVWGGADSKFTRAVLCLKILAKTNADGNGAVFANMTLDASNHENKLILSMDRFVGKLKEVDCASNIRMKFTSNDTYADAIHQWDWVNFNEHRTFILVANYPGCADNNTREPWIVRNVRNEPETLTVHLDAKKSTWDEVSKGVPFKIDFGRHTRTTQPTIAKRFLGGLIDKAKDKVNDVKDTVTDVVDKGKDEVKETVKDVKDGANNIVNQGKEEVKETVKDVKDGASIVKEKGGDLIDKVEDKVKKLKEAVGNPNKQFTVNINKPLPERLFSKSINGLDLAVTCNGGYIKGSVVIMGTIHFDGKGIDSLVVEIEPRGVGIDVPLTLTATGVLGSGFNLPIDLGTLPAIPGFAVTGLFAIGPTLQLDAGFLVSAVTGSITLSTGFSASLNDGAKASFDLKKKKKVALSGWDATGKTKPFKVESAEVSVGAELYVSTGVYVEASIFDRFGGQAGLTIKAPVRIEVTGQYSKNFNLMTRRSLANSYSCKWRSLPKHA